jgi:gluconokinase
LGAALAKALSLPFIDADDLHSPANKDKMSQGKALTDTDRAPWLVSVRNAAVAATTEGKARGAQTGVVVACSALKKSYREVLRGQRAELDLRNSPKGGTRSSIAVSGEDEGVDQKGQDGSEWLAEDQRAVSRTALPQPLLVDAPRTVTFFVHPSGPRDVLLKRMTARGSHFMKAEMLESQLATLEDPAETGEAGIVQVGLEEKLEEQVRVALEGLRTVGAIPRRIEACIGGMAGV